MTGIIAAAGISLLVSFLLLPPLIRILYRFKFGQEIRDDGPQGHKTKQGTPTMGGIAIIFGSVVGYFGAHAVTMTPPTVSGVLVILLFVGLGCVGFLDDFIKIYKRRSLGLRSGAKMLGQIIVGVGFAIGVTMFPNSYTYTPGSTHLSLLRDFGPPMAVWLFVIWALLLIVATSNAVNLTDGLDGLATGATILSLVAYVIIGNWQLRQSCINALEPNCYTVRDPLDLAVVAAAALGGLLVGLAITTRTQLLLLVIGGLFVLITASVIIQVGSFRLTGKRVFRMAPLQHHFELKGWAETTIVIRFWIIQGLFVAAAMALFYLEWMPR